MEEFIQSALLVHIVFGSISLLTGAVTIVSQKGKQLHRMAGTVYFWAMTFVFITGMIVAGYRFNRFLFLIAFLSYYSVFAGVRFLKLKNLHKDQNPKWYDWAAGIINGIVNILFIGLGLYYLFQPNNNLAGALLSIGFGIGGLLLSYTNLQSFIHRPKKSYHWYLAHIGNMMGGYIATFTAFLSTTATRFEIMNPFVAFALPSLIGIPLLMFLQHKIEKSIANPQNS